MLKNKISESFLIILFAVIILFFLSFLNIEGSIGDFKLKKINLFSDIIKKETKPEIIPHKISDTLKVNASENDSVITKDTIVQSKNVAESEIIDYSDDETGFEKFILALKKTKNNGSKTRIAYFGDSDIEGDLITSDLRSMLQNSFGGKGVGFVPITSITAGFRSTIKHTFSENWTEFSFLNTKKSTPPPLGLSGFVFNPLIYDDLDNCSWVKYYSSNKSFKNLNKFYNIKLLYGKGDNNIYINYTAGNKEEIKQLNGNKDVNELVLSSQIPVDNVKINFYSKSLINIFGCSFESDSGIFVDNYSFRGNSGLTLGNIPQNIIKGFDDLLNYNLVVLQYGLNVTGPTTIDLSWYEQSMARNVNYFKENFPNASILIISVSDMSYKNDKGEIETAPSIPVLVEAQRKIAKNTQVTFWNLYEAMGGFNSMKTWVESEPPLANTDYTHINFRGSTKIADLLYKQLMKEYNNYEIKDKSTAKEN